MRSITVIEVKKLSNDNVPSDKETTNTDRYYMPNGQGQFSGTIYTAKGEFPSKKIKVTIEEA